MRGLSAALAAAVLFASAIVSITACAAPGKAQRALPTAPITIETQNGPVKLTVELAETWRQQQAGLMWRKTMAPDAGILFDFNPPQQVSFWMKNTVLPLDMVFIRADGTISSIAANTTPMSETPVPAAEPVRAVLEINAGRAAALGIQPDDRVRGAMFGNARD